MFTLVILCTVLLSGLSSSFLLFPEYRGLGERSTVPSLANRLSAPVLSIPNGLRNSDRPLSGLLNSGPPVKRSAMLINKFMRDIQRSLDQAQQEVTQEIDEPGPESEAAIKRKYSRCYLNAASCFFKETK